MVIAGAVAGLAGATGAAAIAPVGSLGLVVLVTTVAGIGVSLIGLRSGLLSQRTRYERSHVKLCGPRPGAKLG
jgi:hypothetical protein